MGKPISDETPQAVRRRERYALRQAAKSEASLTGHAYQLYALTQTRANATEIVESIKQYLKDNFRV